MSWWFRVPAACGLRPEMRQVGFEGMLTWMALLAIDAQNDFAGELPARFVVPSYLALQYPEEGPGQEALARGLQRCVEASIVIETGDGLRLAADIYEAWRAPKSAKLRKREQRDRDASREVTRSHDESREVTTSHDESRPVTRRHASHESHGTRPDQTRPDQLPLAGESRAPAIVRDIAVTERRDLAWRMAQEHQEAGQELAKAHGRDWRGDGQAGPQRWSARIAQGADEETCRHALAMAVAEADEMAKAGLENPLGFLSRLAFSDEVFARAAAYGSEREAREAVRGRAGSRRSSARAGPKRASVSPATRAELERAAANLDRTGDL